MPQVPREQATVLPGAVPGVRVAPVATPNDFGAGIANVGEDLGLAVFEKATREANQSAITAAERRLAQSKTELQLRMTDLRGRDAAGAVDLLNDEWRKAVASIEAQDIHNEQQRRPFRRTANDWYLELNKAAQVHMHQETNRWQDEETEAYIKTSQDNARLNAGDPEIVQREKLLQREKLIQYGERNGLGKWVDEVPAGPGEPMPNPRSHDWIGLLSPGEVAEGRIADENAVRGPGMFVEGGKSARRTFKGTPEFEQKWAETVSRTNTEVVKGLVYAGQHMEADKYYQANKKDFTAADRDHVEPMLQESTYQGRALGLSRLITEKGMDRRAALKELDAITDPKLHAVAREIVLQRFGDQEVADEKAAQTTADDLARHIISGKFDRKTALEHIDAISPGKVQKLVRNQVMEHFGDTERADEEAAKAGAPKEARLVIGTQMDRTAALTFIDGIEDPKMQQLTRTLVNQHFTDQEAAEKRAHDERFDSAKQRVDQAIGNSPGTEVTPRMVVGPDVWIGLKPEEQNSLNHMAREALHPTDRPNNDNKWFEFHSVLTHEQIAALSPREYRTKYRDHLSNQYRTVADTYYNTIRNAVAKQDSKDPHLSETQTFKDQVEDSFRTSGLLGELNKPKAKWSEEEVTRYVRFERQAASAIEQEELAKKRKLTPSEKQVVIDGVKGNAIKKLWMNRGGLGITDAVLGPAEKALIDLEEDEKGKAIVPLDKIPIQDLEDLRGYIMSKGKTVTIDKLRRAYAQQQLRNRKAFDAIVSE